jgi:hypothetical protein
MNSHFSEETLRQNLDDLVKRTISSPVVDRTGRAICAEARFEVEHTVQQLAYLAHLAQRPAA